MNGKKRYFFKCEPIDGQHSAAAVYGCYHGNDHTNASVCKEIDSVTSRMRLLSQDNLDKCDFVTIIVIITHLY